MKNLSLIISVLIPAFSFFSTLLMTYADRHTVPVDPFSVFHRAAATVNTRGYNQSKAASDIRMEQNNRKMKRIWWAGIICLIISFALSILFIVLQQI